MTTNERRQYINRRIESLGYGRTTRIYGFTIKRNNLMDYEVTKPDGETVQTTDPTVYITNDMSRIYWEGRR
jgi:hypothetical protein